MSLSDTIAAIASPPGRATRAIIRLSGSATREILASILDAPRQGGFDRACFKAALRLPALDSGALRLPVLICTYRAPSSYTGEDSAEILIPGNPLLAERLLAALASLGARPASPGEFSARAYLNDRLSLDQAEGVAATIAAQTDDELAAARELLSARTGRLYRGWAEELATLLALVEAGIDFTDQEDVVAIQPDVLRARLTHLRAAITRFLGADSTREARRDSARIVLFGRSNAGKSTLFNSLLGRRRAVVSPIPGTTRDALEEELDLSGVLPGAGKVTLIDLAGMGESPTAPLDAAAQESARGAIASADAIIYCDPSGRFDDPIPAAKPIIRIITKADLPRTPGMSSHARDEPSLANPADRSGARSPEHAAPLSVCALDGWNLPVLRRAIADAAWGARASGLAALLPRHRRALDQTAERLEEAIAGSLTADPALLASSLRSALDSLGELVGRIAPDDIIGRIFATFCIGK